MAETKAVIFSDGKFQAIGNDGEVVPYGQLYFFDSVSGNVVDTYTTSTQETKNPHPVILSASGKGDVYVGDGQFDVTLQDKNGATVWTINNYIPAGGQVQLDPVTSVTTKEERTGITGNTLILENLPLTTIDIHKNGLYLLTDEYSNEGKIVTFVDPLIATDELIITYGQVLPGQTVGSEWVYQDIIYTYISSSSFKTNGDTTALFLPTRRVKIDLELSSSYAEVVSAVYNAGNDETTIVVSTTVMDNTLVIVGYGIVSPFLAGSGGSLSYYDRTFIDAIVTANDDQDILIDSNTKKDLSVVQNVVTDADITLTADQNLYGRIEITDTGVVLTTGRNVITDNIEHTFLFVNSTAQTLTVKTSAGTGIDVLAGEAKELRNDTVNIIEFEASAAGEDTRLNTADEDYAGQPAGVEILNANAGEWIDNQVSAWVVWNPATGAFLAGQNVSAVVRLSTARYRITLEGITNTNFNCVGSINFIDAATVPRVASEVTNLRTSSIIEIEIRQGATLAEDGLFAGVQILGGRA